MLFDCLGWNRKDCVAEERVEGKYTDYSLSAPHRLLILEAKKEGTYFELPVGSNKQIYKINFFEKNHPQVYEAIKQALNYCLDRGTPFCCVSNGHQIVGFIASRTDGIEPLKGNAIVFDSLKQMQDNFFQFWQSLSKPGIIAHNLAVRLQEGKAQPPPEKISRTSDNFPGYKNRNDLQTNLQIIGDLIIEDVVKSTDEVEFLKLCYLGSGALSQYALVSKKILQTRYSSLFEKTIKGPTLKPLVKKTGVNPEVLADSISRRPVILLGDVGVGKTMFIRHFIKIDADDLLKNAFVF